jgi:N-acetylglucosamine-6-sulfatase
MGKRIAVTCALAAALLAGPDVQVMHGQTSAKPNIVVVMIDDFDLASLWTLVANGKMPNLTKYFISGGSIFTDAFSANGLGGPSRATFLTGQYAHNHGVTWGFPPRDLTVFDESSTVATWLQTAGYRTGHVGRYLTGYGWWTSKTRIPPGWNDWKTLIDPGSNNTEQYSMNLNGTLVDFGQVASQFGVQLHQVDILSVLATDFVKRESLSAAPFFLMVTPGVFNVQVEPTYNVCSGPDAPFYDPFFGGSIYGASQKPASRHVDTIFGNTTAFALPRPPSFNEAEIADKPWWITFPRAFSPEVIDCIQKRYWRKMEGLLSVDDMIGSVFGELERNGELANTVAIFTADNGWLDGQHRFSGKGAPYEEAIRVPLIIRPRSAGTQARVINKLVLNTDLAPTIANLAQATPAHVVDGRTLVPLLLNPDLPWRKIALLEYEGDLDPFAEKTLPPTYFAVRTDRTRPTMYARFPTVLATYEGEFYDLAQDPFQLNNEFFNSARQAEKTKLEQWMNLLKTCKGVGCQILENYFSF